MNHLNSRRLTVRGLPSGQRSGHLVIEGPVSHWSSAVNHDLALVMIQLSNARRKPQELQNGPNRRTQCQDPTAGGTNSRGNSRPSMLWRQDPNLQPPLTRNVGIIFLKGQELRELALKKGSCHAFDMPEEIKINTVDVLATATTMSTIAHALMRGFVRSQENEVQIDALRNIVVGKLKNAEIEGLGYDSQSQLISRTLKLCDEFFEPYRHQIRTSKK